MVHTLYELEMEANRMGYNVVPRYNKLPKLHSCACGGNDIYYEADYNNNVIVRCRNCGFCCIYVRPKEEHVFQDVVIRNAFKKWNKITDAKNKK